MSTSSTIALKVGKDQYRAVSCHADGYLSWNGRMLLKHYNRINQITAIINLGDLSSLDTSIEKPEGHTFKNKLNGYSVFYGRDRGDAKEQIEAQTVKGLKELVKLYETDYYYVYDLDAGGWYYNKGGINNKGKLEFEELTTDAIKKDKE